MLARCCRSCARTRAAAPLRFWFSAMLAIAATPYTEHVPLHDLSREALRPRTRIRGSSDELTVQQALACGFVAPTEPELFKVAVRHQLPRDSSSRARHINTKELGAIEKAARWATRGGAADASAALRWAGPAGR